MSQPTLEQKPEKDRKKGFGQTLWEWLTTVDHKKIGIMYLVSGGLFFLIAGVQAMLIRIQLMVPENDFLTAFTYNELLTMHGTIMIFFAAMPILVGFMNAIVPLQIGARDLAFPFLNALGFWLFLLGALLLNVSWFMGGAPNAGWTNYVPLSSGYEGSGIDFYVLGLQISGFGTLITGINFLVTIINMRAPGMTLMRMPMFTWTALTMSALILFAFPPLTAGLFLVMFDRIFDANFFDVAAGGNVIIWQHLFWIFGHPEVYILILPSFGIISEVIPTFAKKRLFGYEAMVFATILIAFVGFMVWAHHMFTVGLGPFVNVLFGIATMIIAVPTGIKIFNWLFTLWGGRIQFTAASLWALGFIPTFVMGGVTGVMVSVAPADYQYHDSYFVVAHFHYVIVGGVVLAVFAGLHYWWPKMFNRKLNEQLGKATFWLFLIGFHLTFFVQHFLGLWGMPRRYFTYIGGQGLDTGNLISTVGSLLMGGASVLLLINIIMTAIRGVPADHDPWDGRTLEWATPTPVPKYNFAQIPQVRGLDAYWLAKMEGKKDLPAAEPPGPIHMPSPSIIPFIMALGLFISGWGFCLHSFYEDSFIPYLIGIIGLVIAFGCMAIHSLIDDPGIHIEPSEHNKERET